MRLVALALTLLACSSPAEDTGVTQDPPIDLEQDDDGDGGDGGGGEGQASACPYEGVVETEGQLPGDWIGIGSSGNNWRPIGTLYGPDGYVCGWSCDDPDLVESTLYRGSECGNGNEELEASSTEPISLEAVPFLTLCISSRAQDGETWDETTCRLSTSSGEWTAEVRVY